MWLVSYFHSGICAVTAMTRSGRELKLRGVPTEMVRTNASLHDHANGRLREGPSIYADIRSSLGV